MRLFVAIDLTPEIRTALAALIDELQPLTSVVRWVKPEGMHVTLKFIGEVPEGKQEAIRACLEQVHTATPVEIEVRDVGFFPNQRQPRVFWVGIAATPNLAELAAQVETALAALGIPREKRAFVPHLTLGRIRPAPEAARGLGQLREKMATLAARSFGHLTATEFHLYQSKLSPKGAEYRKLVSFPFVRA